MSGRAQFNRAGESFLRVRLLSVVLLILLQARPAVAQLSGGDPLGFFTNVSSRLLQSEFGLSLNRIQIYPTNQYTPAVHRLLQVTANLWETTTNAPDGLPTVFRPLFTNDNGRVYIKGFREAPTVASLQAVPRPILDLTVSPNLPSIGEDDLIFGVPLVIGARKGLPNFNEFTTESTFQITRKLELRKSSVGGADRIYQTNQFFVLSLTMPSAVEFWNSYATNYDRPVSIYVTNRTTMLLTNDSGVFYNTTFVTGQRIDTNNWPSYQPNDNQSFIVAMRTNIPFLPLIGYVPSMGFVSATNLNLYDKDQTLPAPRWGVTITNRIQAMIVVQGTGRILDYVLLGDLTSHRNLSEEISTTDAGTLFNRLWATNALGGAGRVSGRYGVMAQVQVSKGFFNYPSEEWKNYGNFNGNVASEVAKFLAFFDSTGEAGFQGKLGTNRSLQAIVPFSPSRQISMPMVWAANDPLVHYISSELFDITSSGKPLIIQPPGISNTNQLTNIGKKNRRYRPWPIDVSGGESDPDAFNSSIKDPLIRSSDDWNFPTNAILSVESLGQVHRGTPWQTLYLKSSDLGLTNIVRSPSEWAGPAYWLMARKWAQWAGSKTYEEGFYTRPVRDWALVTTLASLVSTNDPRQLLSVNDPNQNHWLATLDGLTVLTNTTTDTNLTSGLPVEFQSLTLSSNSSQALLLVQAIASVRANQPGQVFRSLGDLLTTPELTANSPWLNQSSSIQRTRGLTDEAYEKIPSQLLSLVRADSVGNALQSGALWQIQFTGYDHYPYAIECSTNLVSWVVVSTNYPTNGVFTFTDSSAAAGSKRFYRSVLLP